MKRSQTLPRFPFVEGDFGDDIAVVREAIKAPADVVVTMGQGKRVRHMKLFHATGRIVDDGPPVRVRWQSDTMREIIT